METWAAAFMLLGIQFKDLGLTGEAGVEAVLKSAFTQAGKPVGQLETNSEQLGMFDTLPETAQRALLEGAIDRPGRNAHPVPGHARRLGARRRRCDRQDLQRGSVRLARAARCVAPAAQCQLEGWIQRRMTAPGSVFVAVGAGHLAGPDSVVDMLQKDGYKVRRVQ